MDAVHNRATSVQRMVPLFAGTVAQASSRALSLAGVRRNYANMANFQETSIERNVDLQN